MGEDIELESVFYWDLGIMRGVTTSLYTLFTAGKIAYSLKTLRYLIDALYYSVHIIYEPQRESTPLYNSLRLMFAELQTHATLVVVSSCSRRCISFVSYRLTAAE